MYKLSSFIRSDALIQTLTSAMLPDKPRTSGLLTKNLFFRDKVSGDIFSIIELLLLLSLALIYIIFVNASILDLTSVWTNFENFISV